MGPDASSENKPFISGCGSILPWVESKSSYTDNIHKKKTHIFDVKDDPKITQLLVQGKGTYLGFVHWKFLIYNLMNPTKKKCSGLFYI